MSIKRIQVCEDGEICSGGNDVLLLSVSDVTDNKKTHCSFDYQQDGYAAVVGLEISGLQHVNAHIYDLLLAFDFDPKCFSIVVQSCSKHLSAMDVSILLTVLYPQAKMQNEIHGASSKSRTSKSEGSARA